MTSCRCTCTRSRWWAACSVTTRAFASRRWASPTIPRPRCWRASSRPSSAIPQAGQLERLGLRPAGAALPQPDPGRARAALLGHGRGRPRVQVQQLHLALPQPPHRPDGPAGHNGRANAPLDELAKLCGFPGKLGMDGSKVWEAWSQGRADEVRAYCETDVVNTGWCTRAFASCAANSIPSPTRPRSPWCATRCPPATLRTGRNTWTPGKGRPTPKRCALPLQGRRYGPAKPDPCGLYRG